MVLDKKGIMVAHGCVQITFPFWQTAYSHFVIRKYLPMNIVKSEHTRIHGISIW